MMAPEICAQSGIRDVAAGKLDADSGAGNTSGVGRSEIGKVASHRTEGPESKELQGAGPEKPMDVLSDRNQATKPRVARLIV